MTRPSFCLSLLLCALLGGAFSSASTAQPQARSDCSRNEQLALLDFWAGQWRVLDETGQVMGSNRIYRLLNGCVIQERWQGSTGGVGISLFFVDPESGTLKQVWVTGQALLPGGTKEKLVIESDPGASVVFQGSYPADGVTILDRTTLTRLDNGDVLQLIEISRDGGQTWESGFRGIYTRE